MVVQRGDSLWSIAARDLPAGAGDAAIDLRWREIYAVNAWTVGPDPGLLLPGQRLTIPRKVPS